MKFVGGIALFAFCYTVVAGFVAYVASLLLAGVCPSAGVWLFAGVSVALSVLGMWCACSLMRE